MRVPARKHSVSVVTLNVPAATVQANTVLTEAQAVDDGITSVPIGSRLKAVYVDATIVTDTSAFGTIFWCINKDPGGLNPTVDPQTFSASVGTSQIFGHGSGIPGQVAAGVPYRIVGWFRIPPRYQMVGRNDKVRFNTKSLTAAHSMCARFVFKVI